MDVTVVGAWGVSNAACASADLRLSTTTKPVYQQVKEKNHLHHHLIPIVRIHQDPLRLDPLFATLVALACAVSAWRMQVMNLTSFRAGGSPCTQPADQQSNEEKPTADAAMPSMRGPLVRSFAEALSDRTAEHMQKKENGHL